MTDATTRPHVVVARAGAADAEAIRALPDLGGPTRRLLDRDLARADHRCLVVRTGTGAVVAFAAVTAAAGEAHLLDLAVAPDWRRRGLATRLVARLRSLARDELGATAMTLEVRRGNAPARALYRHLGFVEAGVRPGYYPDGGPEGGREDAVVMWDHDPPVPD